MDPRFSVRGAAQERAARRRLIYLLLRNGDIGSLAGERQARDHRAAVAPGQPLDLHAVDLHAAVHEHVVDRDRERGPGGVEPGAGVAAVENAA
jgi:hypothetical protein